MVGKVRRGRIKQIIASSCNFYAITDDDQIYSCGDFGNESGWGNKDIYALNKINPGQKIKSVVAYDNSLYVLTEDG